VKRRIAFFDFDGTITSKDTLAEIIRFQKGKLSYYFGLILCSPLLLANKLKLVSDCQTNRWILAYFFKNSNHLDFQDK
jgi:hypothetical protein